MKRTFTLFTVIICSITLLTAQKKPLDHSVYDNWKSLGIAAMSQDGKFSLYPVNAQAGDGYLVQSNLLNGSSVTIDRGKNPAITFDSKYGVCTIAPFYEETRQAKIKKKKAEDMPKDTLCIWTLGQSNYKKFSNVSVSKTAKEGSLAVAFKTDRTPSKGEGSNLMLYYFATGKIDTLKHVTDFAFNKAGTELFIIRKHSAKESSPMQNGLYLYNLATQMEQALLTGFGKARFSLPVSDKNEQFFAFYANLDTTKAAEKLINIYFFKKGASQATLMVDSKVKGLPKDWIISPNGTLAINKTGSRLFFGIAPKPLEKDTTLIDFETAKLDVWHYLDDYIQPVQLIQLQQDLQTNFLSYIQINQPQNGLIQLATPEYPSVQIPSDYSSEWGYGIGDKSYRIESQWSLDAPNDLYIISIADGYAKKIVTAEVLDSYSASPQNKYLNWYNRKAKAWFAYEIATGSIRNLTDGIGVNFWNESNDRPQLSESYGNGGWRESDAAFFVYDMYDIWEVDPNGIKVPVMLTSGLGRKQQYTFRISQLTIDASESAGIKPKDMLYFSVFDNVTKFSGFYCKDQSKKQTQMQLLTMGEYAFGQLQRSNDGKLFTFSRSNFSESPNLWMTQDLFKTKIRLSDINPQQNDYNWGTAELVHWTSANGIPCEGILYKPEDFDPAKKYPMILYLYETWTHLFCRYWAPSPQHSSMTITFAVSNGYLVFIPDVHFIVGHPGQSAMNCIMPGVDMLCQNSWVDEKNMAIQGLSWGGYEVAYMITQTNRFKAATASAPVSNMTSAYGGIRWGSGKVRQIMYEAGQSRIGKNLWEGFDLYIENSPIFHIQNVTTPLMIMHNDNDGAVPWYQGIEYFTALRRLGKQVWMLNYNGEDHGIGLRASRKDLTIRVEQFYNHFLKGAPAPVWIKKGVPATKKGIEWGLGYE